MFNGDYAINYIYILFRINPLSLVEILAHIVVQFEDDKEAIQFLEKTEAKVKSSNEAVALCKVLSGQILLEKLGDQEGTKVITFNFIACNRFFFVIHALTWLNKNLILVYGL